MKPITKKQQNQLTTLGIFVREHRLSLGLTQNELSQKINVNLKTIQRLEKGMNITLLTLYALSDGMNLDPNQLLQED